MSIQSPRRRVSSRRGSQAVEFALCLPILVLVLGGIIEYGLMFNQYLSVLSAARDGSRWGATPGVNGSDAEEEATEQVRESLAMLGLGCTSQQESLGECKITSELTDVEGLDAIKVLVEIAYEPITGGLLPVPDKLAAESYFVLINQIPDTGAG
ncbi:MAG: Flp pilus assembly protein TadG [Myxococcota bacterium]|jgi:Flp pilus assembly protein TadG